LASRRLGTIMDCQQGPTADKSSDMPLTWVGILYCLEHEAGRVSFWLLCWMVSRAVGNAKTRPEIQFAGGKNLHPTESLSLSLSLFHLGPINNSYTEEKILFARQRRSDIFSLTNCKQK
jgi:hypothetical protein